MGTRRRKKGKAAKAKAKKTAAAKRLAKKNRRAKCEGISTANADLIEQMLSDEFVAQNADRIWLKQNGMWGELMQLEIEEERRNASPHEEPPWTDWDDDPPSWDELSRSPRST